MDVLTAQIQAATALSTILKKHGIGHAFIGGFALNLLGHQRETEDIDVEIDGTRDEMRGRIAQILTQDDSRFSVEG